MPGPAAGSRRHVRHDATTIILVTALFAFIVSGSAMLIGLRFRRKLFAGPAREAWDQARHGLTRGEQLRVQRATKRRHPVSRAALAPAQLAFSRFVEDVAERSPMRRRAGKVAMTVVYLSMAAEELAFGAAEGPPRGVFYLVFGSLFAVLAVVSAPLISRSLAQQPARMRRLRIEVRRRYPDNLALSP